VTGAARQVASGAEAMVRRIRAHTTMPIALGFGISRPEHVAEVCAYADAAVVGSALVSVIARRRHDGADPAGRELRAVVEGAAALNAHA
jgi:tryptophan synthase alpha chain